MMYEPSLTQHRLRECHTVSDLSGTNDDTDRISLASRAYALVAEMNADSNGDRLECWQKVIFKSVQKKEIFKACDLSRLVEASLASEQLAATHSNLAQCADARFQSLRANRKLDEYRLKREAMSAGEQQVQSGTRQRTTTMS